MILFKLPPGKAQIAQHAQPPTGVVTIRAKADGPIVLYALNKEQADARMKAVAEGPVPWLHTLGAAGGTEPTLEVEVPPIWFLVVENHTDKEVSGSYTVTTILPVSSGSTPSGAASAWGASGYVWGDPRLKWGRGKG